MEKRTLMKDLAVVVRRLPFVDKTNKLQMPSKNTEEVTKAFKKCSDKGIENSSTLSYFKNNPVNSDTGRTKSDLKKGSTTVVSGKRVRKKTLPCRGCDCNLEHTKSVTNSLKSVENPDRNISTTSSSGSESANETVITTSGERIKKLPCNGRICTLETSPPCSINCLKMIDEKVSNTTMNRSASANETVTKKVGKDLCHDYKFSLQCKVLIENANLSELVKMTSSNSKHGVSTSTVTDSACHWTVSEETCSEPARKSPIPSMPAKSLRNQIRPNYAEITLDTSQEKEANTPVKKITKVPVYKQQIEVKTSKLPDNLYEFDESDSERDKQQRKRKRFPNKSRKRRAPLNTVSQKNNNKVLAKSKIIWKRKGFKVVKKSPRKYNEVMQEIIQKVIVKINNKHKPVTQTSTNIAQVVARKISTATTSNKRGDKGNLQTEKLAPSSEGLNAINETFNVVKVPAQKVLIVNVTNIPHLKLFEISSENIKIQDNLHKLDATASNFKRKTDQRLSNRENISQIDRNIIAEDNSGDIFPPELDIGKKSTEEERLDGSSDIFPPETSNYETSTGPTNNAAPNYPSSTNLQFRASSSKEKSARIYPEAAVGRDSSADLFPCETNEGLTEHNNLERQLNPASQIDDEENLGAEDVVDTDYDDRSEQGAADDSFLELDGSPWKTAPKVNIISNVLLSQVKHNPWRFNDYITRNPHFIMLKTTALPCLRQDMVLDHSQIEKIEEHFSKTPRRVETPRKSPVQKTMLDYITVPGSIDKENQPRSSLFDYDDFSPIKMKSLPHGDAKNKAKRNILAPIQNNTLNTGLFTSTPTRSDRRKASFNPTSIGYDENEDIANYFGFDDDDGDVAKSKGAVKRSVDKPYRINGKFRKKNMEEVEEVEESLPVEEPDESQAVGNSMDVVLFEDPEKDFTLNVPSKIYVRKPRRKRLKSVEVENEENHPKKRKKDMMTKAEEAELENWAARFNSMCAEIDKYDLEIE